VHSILDHEALVSSLVASSASGFESLNRDGPSSWVILEGSFDLCQGLDELIADTQDNCAVEEPAESVASRFAQGKLEWRGGPAGAHLPNSRSHSARTSLIVGPFRPSISASLFGSPSERYQSSAYRSSSHSDSISCILARS